jgi:hypothetical protein
MNKKIKYNQTLGFYKPAFFYMELDVEDDFEKILKCQKSESVFFHEYIHFLQDILTTYGINNIRSILLLLRDKISYMQKNEYQELPVDFKSIVVDDFNKQFKFTYGINDENKMKVLETIDENIIITKIRDETAYIGKNPLKMYYLSFEGIPYEYQLGSIDIIESMAFLLEHYTFGKDVYNSPTLPYKTVDILIRNTCPNSFPGIEYVVAICELSLRSGNPMMFLIKTIIKFQDINYEPDNLYDFINKVIEDINIECNGIVYVDTSNPYFMILDEVISELHYIFGNDKYFENILLWLDTLLGKMKEIKKYEKYLPITKYFLNNNPKDHFHNLICNIIGTPIIYIPNNKRGYYFEVNNATEELFFLRVLDNFFDSLYYGSACKMRKYCNEKSKIEGTSDTTDDNCTLSPSLRSEDSYVDLCPYGALWKYFKLISTVKYKKDV